MTFFNFLTFCCSVEDDSVASSLGLLDPVWLSSSVLRRLRVRPSLGSDMAGVKECVSYCGIDARSESKITWCDVTQ